MKRLIRKKRIKQSEWRVCLLKTIKNTKIGITTVFVFYTKTTVFVFYTKTTVFVFYTNFTQKLHVIMKNLKDTSNIISTMTNTADYAKVYNLANKIFKGYDRYRCMMDKEEIVEDSENQFRLIDDVIKESGAVEGDILFVGSHYDSRQEYGIVINAKHEFKGHEVAYYNGPKGLVRYAKELYPNRHYTHAYNHICACWNDEFNCYTDIENCSDYESDEE